MLPEVCTYEAKGRERNGDPFSFCQRRFSADSGLIGQTLNVNDVALTIVGVMPEGFFGLVARTSGFLQRWRRA
jgi:hypothetical protein